MRERPSRAMAIAAENRSTSSSRPAIAVLKASVSAWYIHQSIRGPWICLQENQPRFVRRLTLLIEDGAGPRFTRGEVSRGENGPAGANPLADAHEQQREHEQSGREEHDARARGDVNVV